MKARYNSLEQKVNEITNQVIKFKHSYDTCNTLDLVEERKHRDNSNKFFHDVKSPYKTIKGNQRTTEMVVYAPEYNLHLRLECKEQKTVSSLIYGMYFELECVKDLPEDIICYILDGVYTDLNVNKLLTDKVKALGISNRVWIGSLKEYEAMIRKAVNK